MSRSVVDTQPDVGLLLAAAAYQLDDTADTQSTLLNALETHPLLDGLIYGVDSGLEAAAFSPDGDVLATPTSDGTGTILWDSETQERVATLESEEHGGSLEVAASSAPFGACASAAGSLPVRAKASNRIGAALARPTRPGTGAPSGRPTQTPIVRLPSKPTDHASR